MGLYDAGISSFVRGLGVAIVLVGKAERLAKGKRLGAKKVLGGKLAPDMFNFVQQVQYVYFMALEAGEQLSGKKPPAFTYDEASFADLKKSLARARAYMQTIKQKDMSGAERKKVQTFLMPKKRVAAATYIHTLALPNFYFHLTTMYGILRHLGAPLKKDDYLGA